MKKSRKTCGNCRTIKPHNDTHVMCLNEDCESCDCLVSKNRGGCKHWSENKEAKNEN